MAVSPAAIPVQTTTRNVGIEPGPRRVLSIDAFRGFTMTCMIGEGWGLEAKALTVLTVIAFEISVRAWLYRHKIFFKL